ncbi:preprotein translocase subunit YajC [Actinoallomurus rhizosphaericola]|uniref:preprotein translocase subunit YajC n=1 Tax=Actinoallomurus rhizosphaericola TaxID=2952536 RepID=UPI002093825A|nr:preprotein translocase subunit YajC [Actinoallomurus rhizosphaericola]MCO5996863.1 preprotein translocase subunit YajC [Actinoallomurus rhizosphaericola]
MQGNTTITALTHVVAAKSGGNPLMSLLPLILIVVVFYFLLIRPQRRRQQQQAQLQNQLVPGQRVMTTAGMLATVVAVEDDALVLEIAPGVEARFVKQAIGQVLDDSSDEEEDEEVDETEEPGQEHAADEAVADDEPEVAQDDIEPKTDAKTVAEDKASAETLKDGEQRAGKKPSA